jgi:hypothetical protein
MLSIAHTDRDADKLHARVTHSAVPLDNRWGGAQKWAPNDQAHAIVFLASDEAAYSSGHCIYRWDAGAMLISKGESSYE